MTAKTKWPEKVWVGFATHDKNIPVVVVPWKPPKNLQSKYKRYRLDRGNEVARALNVLDHNVDKYSHRIAVEDLRRAGVKVRWVAKEGRFV